MSKVLIISISRDEQQKLQEASQMSVHKNFTFETTASFGQEASWWTENVPDCLIISLPSDDLMQGYFLTKLRVDVPRTLPVLILCSTISASLMQLSQIFSKVRMLKVPVAGGDLLRALVDLTTQYAPGQHQVHPRYLTEQEIIISSDLSSEKLTAMMKNLSLSGAYFESPVNTMNIKIGDLIKISVLIGQPEKEYSFDAKVVWMKPLSAAPGSHGYGITFVNKEDVYNNLLKGF